MDFDLDEELSDLRDLAREVFSSEVTPNRVREVERSATRHDEALWESLAATGLLGIGIGEQHGGAGLGMPGLAVVLQEQGRVVAPVALWSHAVAMSLVDTHADPDLAAEVLPGAVDGRHRLGLALEEYDVADPARPATTATREDDGAWRLSGTKSLVPTADGVSRVLASATTASGTGLFLVEPDDPGATWELSPVTTHDLAGDLHLDRARATAIGEPRGDTVGVSLRRAAVALAALQVGVCEGALSHAVTYLAGREQFGRALGSFQAVQHQLADCQFDIDAMQVVLWQALSDGQDVHVTEDHSRRSALVAKWWCDQAGLDVVHRVQHVHGGMGVDVDYPVHRHFLWGKQIANTLGGAEATLAQLGTVLSAEAMGR